MNKVTRRNFLGMVGVGAGEVAMGNITPGGILEAAANMPNPDIVSVEEMMQRPNIQSLFLKMSPTSRMLYNQNLGLQAMERDQGVFDNSVFDSWVRGLCEEVQDLSGGTSEVFTLSERLSAIPKAYDIDNVGNNKIAVHYVKSATGIDETDANYHKIPDEFVGFIYPDMTYDGKNTHAAVGIELFNAEDGYKVIAVTHTILEELSDGGFNPYNGQPGVITEQDTAITDDNGLRLSTWTTYYAFDQDSGEERIFNVIPNGNARTIPEQYKLDTSDPNNYELSFFHQKDEETGEVLVNGYVDDIRMRLWGMGARSIAAGFGPKFDSGSDVTSPEKYPLLTYDVKGSYGDEGIITMNKIAAPASITLSEFGRPFQKIFTITDTTAEQSTSWN